MGIDRNLRLKRVAYDDIEYIIRNDYNRILDPGQIVFKIAGLR